MNEEVEIENSQIDGEDFTEENENTVNDIVKILLNLEYSKKPIKHSDISSSLPNKPGRKQWTMLMERAKTRLLGLGLKLVDAEATSVKSYLLVQSSNCVPNIHRLLDEGERAERTLLMMVLAYIFMKEGTVNEDELWSHLSYVKIVSEEKPVHSYFGDVKKKILGLFVEEHYLVWLKGNEDVKSQLKWGQRAELEVSKMAVLQFVCDVGFEGKMKPSDWVSHYQRAVEADGETPATAEEPLRVE